MTINPASTSHPSSNHHDARATLGVQGEQIALKYLEESGYLLEAQNWRGQRGELDLVMRRESLLVIIEVRTTSTQWLDRPAEATTMSKQRQVARCADEYFCQRHPQAPKILDIRFDIIGVLVSPDSTQTPPVIDHVDNAYYSPFAF